MTASGNQQQRPVLVMAGGTGGHVVPALSVAEIFRQSGIPVAWLGTQAGIEARLVPAAGIPIHWLKIGGLRGKGGLTKLLAPLRLLAAVVAAAVVIIRLRPQAVLGMGGFASGPGGLAARLLGKRLVIHEQNAVAGLTNRTLAKLTSQVAAAYPQAFAEGKATAIGNPVRHEIAALAEPAERYASRDGTPLNVLVLGGSQGARKLNEVLPVAFAQLAKESTFNVLHQTGQATLEATRERYTSATVNARVEAYIDDMASAYAEADLVICRSGALTVAEVCAAGVAALFIPFPFAVDDHQTANAGPLVDCGAAEIIQERDLTPDGLAQQVVKLGGRDKLQKMATQARSLAMPDAAKALAAFCLPQLAVQEVGS